MSGGEIADRIPYVGVGCIVVRDGKLLLVRNWRGFWSTPPRGGHLDFGESPDFLLRVKHSKRPVSPSRTSNSLPSPTMCWPMSASITVWMRGDANGVPAQISDTSEIDDLGWFSPEELPSPLYVYFQNLLNGRCWPRSPANLPFTTPKP